MGSSEYWVDGRRKRAMTVSGAGGGASDRESRKEVAEVEWKRFLARELAKAPVSNSRERRKAKRQLLRRIQQHQSERLRRVNGL